MSILMLAGFALLGGAVYLWRRGGLTRQPILMLIAAGVMFANVAILSIPVPPKGDSEASLSDG
jgi:hypothetical protein